MRTTRAFNVKGTPAISPQDHWPTSRAKAARDSQGQYVRALAGERALPTLTSSGQCSCYAKCELGGCSPRRGWRCRRVCVAIPRRHVDAGRLGFLSLGHPWRQRRGVMSSRSAARCPSARACGAAVVRHRVLWRVHDVFDVQRRGRCPRRERGTRPSVGVPHGECRAERPGGSRRRGRRTNLGESALSRYPNCPRATRTGAPRQHSVADSARSVTPSLEGEALRYQ